MKKNLKKGLSLLLAALMIMTSIQVFASEELVAQEGVTATEDVVNETADENEIVPMSLLPIEEVDVVIDLSDYLPATLANVKIADVLSKMVDEYTQEPIEIDPSATTVWSNYFDENGNQVYDVWKVMGMEDTIDLVPEYYTNRFYLELIVGSGNQLDTNNVRYIAQIYLPDSSKTYDFELYEQIEQLNEETPDDETDTVIVRNPIKYRAVDSSIGYDNEDGTYTYVPYMYLSIPPKYTSDADYYLNIAINSELYPGIDISVYSGLYKNAEEAIAAASKDNSLDITEQITGQTMTEKDAGYKSKWATRAGRKELTIVYRKNDEIVGSDSFELGVNPRTNHVWGNSIYNIDKDGNQEHITYSNYYDYEYLDDNHEKMVSIETYELNAGHSANEDYYFTMYFNDGETETTDNSKVTKAVVGFYDSLEAASEQPDIKESLFFSNYYEEPEKGYKANFSGDGIDFTIFAAGEIWYYTIIIKDNSNPDTDFDDEAPVVGSSDRYFRVYGLYDSSADSYNRLDTYVLPYEHDTYYSYGYQALLINDKDVDMTALKPDVILGDNAKVYHNGVLEETDDSYNNTLSAQDFSKIPEDLTRDPRNSVKYTVSAENHIDQKNYWVTVVKKESGAKLFVNGPDEREIFLNDYFDNVHDIFIANIGDEELTGLKVTLDATNVKLDDYWTVGGEGNDTLAPFTETYASNRNYNGELFNVGKIRLIPDGEGDIKGTLTIEADGQEKRVINLKGKAGNPRIDTDSLHDAVKYVPYQSIITTTNMHDWNKVTFELYSGDLPEGVELLPSGELYGVPKETGTFKFKVRANYSHSEFTDSIATLTLNVLENTDENVDAQVDEGYEIITRVPDFRTASDQVFELEYDYAEHKDEYQGFYLDGDKLEPDVDYTIEAGSTKITIKSQTINNAGNGTHTIAAEYRNSNNEVKKAAQNYNYGSSSGGSSSGGSSGGSGGGSRSGGTTSYKVWFEVNGGAWLDAVTVKKGDTISSLPTPERNGFAFGGWYKDAELTQPFDSNEKITATTTLYAKWVELYTIWFIENGGEPVDDMSVQSEQTASVLPTPIKDGFVFDGWYKDEALTQAYDINEPVTASISLYAKWIEDKAPVDASGFRDVSKTDWFYSDVEWAYRNKFMIGVSNVDFAPNDLITGGMVVTVLARLAKVDVSKYENLAYDDIYENEWYTPYAKWAKAEGLVDGIPFNPPEEISRESMAVILVRFLDYVKAEYNVNDEVIRFADEELISKEAMEALQTLFKLSIFQGVGNNTIDPISFTTRAQLAALIHRIDEYVK